MNPIGFPQANTSCTPPPGIEECQCQPVPACVSQIGSGSLDGYPCVTVAWMPTDIDRARIAAGEPVYLTCLGCIPPHLLATTFEEATHPL